MTIYDDYITYHDKYVEQFGEKTIVFLQVGDFFELYGVQNDTENVGPDMYSIGDMCGLVITRKNKSIPENSRSNPLMAGFPIHAFQKQAQLLINQNYTVIVIRQVTPPPNVQRKVTEIISPSTYIHNNNNSTSNYLMAYIWSEVGLNTYVGIAGVDLFTGHTWVYEINQGTDALEEAYRLLQIYAPKEIMIRGLLSPTAQKQVTDALQHSCIHADWKSVDCSIAFQNSLFEKAYGKHTNGILTPIEQLGLEKYELGRLALISVLQFAYEHNDQIIQKLRLPELILNEKTLMLEYNSALQLNLISHHPQEKPLLDILNRTSSTLGSRLFRERLLLPLTNPIEIEERYSKIQKMIDSKQSILYASQLRKVIDLERAIRRMILQTFHPMEWISFATSFDVAQNILPSSSENISNIVKEYENNLNLEECSKYNLSDIRSNIFKTGLYPEIDECGKIIKSCFDFFDKCIAEIGTELCRLDCNERDGYSICITKKRWETYKKSQITSKKYLLPIDEVNAKPISSTSTMCRLSHKKLEVTAQTIMEQQRKIQNLAQIHYKVFLQNFVEKCQKDVLIVAKNLAEIDVICTCARNAIDFDYCKPTVDSINAHGWFDIKGIRHPIIERFESQVAYVQNDISMGANGMLLYGINSSGKSSFMKAVGLNMIMAQAGMYTAATDFIYQPYHHIFTRIASTDNIYRGMSSFVVEMSELRMILNRADEFSLVLGDELCAGTESISALSIVSAGVEYLASKKATFLFATHLHELTDYTSELQNVRVAHMHINIQGTKIIYDRTLLEGKGNPMYGLEVCYALQLPENFLQNAQKIRRKIMEIPNELVASKTSRYNAKILMNVCTICGINPAIETHHIKHQANANANGFVEKGLPIHHMANLLTLCEKCHLEQHHGDIEAKGYRQTSEGIELIIEPKKQNEKVRDDLTSIRTYISYVPLSGWKKKTVTGIWRSCQWNVIQKELAKLNIKYEDEADIRSKLLTRY